MHRYRRVEKIGYGTFSTVYKALRKTDGKYFAMKICSPDPEDLAGILVEAVVFTQVRHSNLAKCHEVFFHENSKIVLILDLAKCDLYGIMDNPFNLERCAICILHILCGLNHLHNVVNVSHCDIKPDNILYDENDGMFKITDFNSVNVHGLHDTPGTTRYYRAPESFEGKYGPESDIWSVGCIMYELLTKKKLFHSDNSKEHLEMLKNFEEKIKTIVNMDPIAGNLLCSMLTIDPTERITAKEAIKHPFIAPYTMN